MALVVKDRVRETSTSTGTGTIILNGAVSGFQGFSVIGDGNTTYYTIVDAATGSWEVGIGTYTLTGATLSRDSVLESSNAGNKVDFAAGTKDVFCTYPAERSVYVEGSTITPAVAATLPVVSGGTGATSLTGYVKGTGTSPLTASATIPNTDISGLGTMSTQNANGVAITGGTINDTAIGGTTPAAGAFTSVTASLPSVISVNSASTALRITQTGTGNALLVEDSANPDSTPVVIDASGRMVVGATASQTNYIAEINNYGDGLAINRWTNSTGASLLSLNKSRGVTAGSQVIGVSGDDIGAILFKNSDGTSLIDAAQILAEIDGTPGTNDMPGRLVFSTTADGASSPTEAVRINSSQSVGIGATSLAGVTLFAGKNITGGTTAIGVLSQAAIQSDVTTSAAMFRSRPSTAAATFTLGTLSHYDTIQNAFGLNSTVTNQYGFNVSSTLTGATNNYGFYSNIASGTGRWNFYAAGSAANYFAGSVGIGSVPTTSAILNVSKNATGATTTSSIIASTTVQSDVTSLYNGYRTYIATQAAAFTLSSANHFYAAGGSAGDLGAGSAITNQRGFHAESSLNGATNNYGFFSNIASGTGRWNFYAAGSAANYFAGGVAIGSPVNANSIGGGADLVLNTSGGGRFVLASSTGRYYFISGESADRIDIGYRGASDTVDVNVLSIDSTTNLGIYGQSFGSGTKVVFIGNATAAPSTNPTDGGILYVEAGALKYRGSSGTVTTIANA